MHVDDMARIDMIQDSPGVKKQQGSRGRTVKG